ncbi:MAG TPA: efflux RND transporter periplasmic adaptor subunit [Paludibaculum sp.]|jgi:RND family efflux transporter MFP subunit
MNDSENQPQPNPGTRHQPTEHEMMLKAEIARLRENAARATDLSHAPLPQVSRPTNRTLIAMTFLILVVIAGAFFGGYLPRVKVDSAVVADARAGAEALLVVNVSSVKRASELTAIELPGSIQAVTEAPILARADGYLKSRLVDIGDLVSAGQLLGEIEAEEVDHQVMQTKAALHQSQAALEQSIASLEQARANEQLAKVTAQRWSNLLQKGVVSPQENDTYQAQSKAQSANVRALERAVAAARSNVEAANANVERIDDVQAYRKVRAPFAGVITMRNVDTGALIAAGQTLLFRVAQTGTLRTYANIPQAYAEFIHTGMGAKLTFANLPGRVFQGKVVRAAHALDPGSRTMLAEIQIPNPTSTLMPGMYCNVMLDIVRTAPPLIIPGDTLVVRPQGPVVATVTAAQTIHFQTLTLGRDFGKEIEVLQGLQEGQLLVANPNDAVHEGMRVQVNRLKAD